MIRRRICEDDGRGSPDRDDPDSKRGDCTAMGQKTVPAVATPPPTPVKVTPVKAQATAPKTVDPNTI